MGKEKSILKPCPFCGGEAREEYMSGYYFVQCNRCAASVRGRLKYSDAVKEWNTRANQSEQ